VTDGDKGDIVVSASGTVWTIDPTVLSTAGRDLINDADAATQRGTLGLGSIATLSSTGFAASTHNHSGTYEPVSTAILRSSDIGVTLSSVGHAHSSLYEPLSTGLLRSSDIGVTVSSQGHTHTEFLRTLDQIPLATTNVNFNGQQATSFRIQNSTADPIAPTIGQIWLRTDL